MAEKTVFVEFLDGPLDGLVEEFHTAVEHYEYPILDASKDIVAWHCYFRIEEALMVYCGVQKDEYE